PLDIRRKDFLIRFRGYDKKEVKEFLEIIAKELEEIIKEKDELFNRISGLEEKVANYQRQEKLLQETLMTVKKQVEDLKNNAKKEAENILEKARLEAKEMIMNAQKEVDKLREEFNTLNLRKRVFLSNLKGLIEGLNNFIKEWEKENEREDKGSS
ncbi:MAG: DivIVA domain-containing protein, partial [candidate division WOR-3 bacterium]|nr:DivIVA domain-containing protein [candidate division WOR-3 bacterium]